MTRTARQPAERRQEPLKGSPGSSPMAPTVLEPQTGSEGVGQKGATIEDALRRRLIAALRPRMTLIEAQMTADQLVPEVLSWGEFMIGVALGAQAELIGDVVSAAQDLLEALPTAGGGPEP